MRATWPRSRRLCRPAVSRVKKSSTPNPRALGVVEFRVDRRDSPNPQTSHDLGPRLCGLQGLCKARGLRLLV